MYALLRICALVPLLGLLLIAPAAAGTETLSLSAAEQQALANDASLARLQAIAEATRERGIADGALPDPRISLGYRNLPVDTFSTTQEAMTMLSFGVSQRFPAGRSRHLRRERADIESRAILAERDHRALEIQREVRRHWLDWQVASESLAIARDAEAVFAELVEIVERRLATGSARNMDLTQARLELAALQERIITFDAEREAAAAALSRWLDAPLREDRQPAARPHWARPQQERLREQLVQHPALEAPSLRIAHAEKGSELARQAYRPEWGVELGYGVRRARDPQQDDARRPDFLTGMVSLSVPLFTGDRQDRLFAAAEREHSAAQHTHSDRLREFDAQLQRAVALWQRHEELAALYREQLLLLAADNADITLSAYRAEHASFDELIRARINELDIHIRQLRAKQRRDSARIDLLYLAGE